MPAHGRAHDLSRPALTHRVASTAAQLQQHPAACSSHGGSCAARARTRRAAGARVGRRGAAALQGLARHVARAVQPPDLALAAARPAAAAGGRCRQPGLRFRHGLRARRGPREPAQRTEIGMRDRRALRLQQTVAGNRGAPRSSPLDRSPRSERSQDAHTVCLPLARGCSPCGARPSSSCLSSRSGSCESGSSPRAGCL